MSAIELVKVAIVRDAENPNADRISITRPADALPLLKEIANSDREHFVCLHLDARNRVAAMETVSIGSLNASLVHPREIFKGAILSNAASLLLGHNHPSGDPTPSREDIELTRRLTQAAEIMGMEIVDHIIVCPDGRFLSMKESNLL